MVARGKLLRIFVLAMLVASLVSCGLLVSFDDVDTGSAATDGVTFAVRGAIDGLGGAKASLVLNGNGASAIVVGDGPFVFTERLADGASYAIDLLAAVPGHPCAFERAKGSVAGADVTDVAIHCPVSHDAELTSLVLSAAELSPAFDPKRDAYTAKPTVERATTVTAAAREPGATIVVQGAPVISGQASAAIPVAVGANHIDVDVTAADGVTKQHYGIDVVGGPTIDYIKASNTLAEAKLGTAVAMAGDTLVIGAPRESSLARGVNANPSPYSATSLPTGAVYVFTRTGGVWSQQAYLKASNNADVNPGAEFGSSVAIAGDTLVVGAPLERSKATGVNGDGTDTSAPGAGAVYVFTRTAGVWTQQAYVKASNTSTSFIARFGAAVAISGDTLAVGADYEGSNGVGVNGSQALGTGTGDRSGAAFVFTRAGTAWSQQAYLKASNSRGEARFGTAVGLSGDTLVVGALNESSAATGVNGDGTNTAAMNAGAAYVFARTGTTWAQQAYLKASNTRAGALFGAAVAVSGDTVVVGSFAESSGSGMTPADTSAPFAGAAYVFVRAGTSWAQQAYVKPAHPRKTVYFGAAVAIDGDDLVVGAPYEQSNAKGFDGDQTNAELLQAGAVFLLQRRGGVWSPRAYLKATNTREAALFGTSVAASAGTVAAGAPGDPSKATGVNGNAADTTAVRAGAAFVFR